MSQTFTPLPQHPGGGQASTGRVVLWFFLAGVAFWPRLWIILFWIFGSEIGHAFRAWIVPAIGFVILPWTTVLYAWMWSIGSDGVHGWEWITVVLAFLVDVWFWFALRRSLR